MVCHGLSGTRRRDVACVQRVYYYSSIQWCINYLRLHKGSNRSEHVRRVATVALRLRHRNLSEYTFYDWRYERGCFFFFLFCWKTFYFCENDCTICIDFLWHTVLVSFFLHFSPFFPAPSSSLQEVCGTDCRTKPFSWFIFSRVPVEVFHATIVARLLKSCCSSPFFFPFSFFFFFFFFFFVSFYYVSGTRLDCRQRQRKNSIDKTRRKTRRWRRILFLLFFFFFSYDLHTREF